MSSSTIIISPPDADADASLHANITSSSKDIATITTSSSSPSAPPQTPKKWSHTAITPIPKWRFVNNAKSTTGYNSTAAGKYIVGLSSEELAAKYHAPVLKESDAGTKDGLEVGKLQHRGYADKNEKGWREVGRLDIEEGNGIVEENMVGKVRWLSKRWDGGAEELQEEENDLKQSEEQQSNVVQAAETESLKENEDMLSEHNENEEKEATTIIVPIEQIEQVQEAKDPVVTIDANNIVEEEQEQPSQKEETAPCLTDEEAPIEKSPMTLIDDEKQESPPPVRKLRCLLLLALLMFLVAIIIGCVFGTSSGHNSLEQNDSIASSVPEQPPRRLCPANEKYVSIRHYTQQSLPTSQKIVTTTTPSIDATTWSLKDSCTGQVLLKCEPCLFSDKGDITFEFIEKRSHIIGESKSNNDGEDIRRMTSEHHHGSSSNGICVPDDREYIFEVRKTNGTDEDRCCNFDATTFYVTYDNVTVVDSAHTIIDGDGGVTSTSFSDETVAPCPTDSPSTCVAAGEDINLCLAIDMSGSLCNRGSGYECPGCILETHTTSLCNRDGLEIRTCCGNFHTVKEFAKRLISVFATIPSEQSYSLVGFATNASFVSNLIPLSADALSSLDSLAYSGGRTNHAAAISSCQQTFSNPNVNAMNRKNMIILITDGNPTEPREENSATLDAIAAAMQVKEAGSILIPVMLTTSSIDNETAEYMSEISSEGLFLNASLSALDSVEESLLSKVLCEE